MTGAVDPFSTTLWPLEMRLKEGGTLLQISFEDGSAVSLSAEYLRIESPSAEVQGHGSGQKITVAGAVFVKIVAIEPVGHYAAKLRFDDGHETGIYTWRYLHQLGVEKDWRWPAYLTALDQAGLSRSPK